VTEHTVASLSNKDGMSGVDTEPPLLVAIKADDADQVQRLLDSRADAEAKREFGWCALHVAAGNGSDAAVSLLLGARATVDARSDDGETPLHLAAQEGKDATVRLLVSYRADVGATNSDGETPLHIAVQYVGSKCLDHIGALLELRADPAVRDSSGMDAFKQATIMTNRGKELVELLGVRKGTEPALGRKTTSPASSRISNVGDVHTACGKDESTAVKADTGVRLGSRRVKSACQRTGGNDGGDSTLHVEDTRDLEELLANLGESSSAARNPDSKSKRKKKAGQNKPKSALHSEAAADAETQEEPCAAKVDEKAKEIQGLQDELRMLQIQRAEIDAKESKVRQRLAELDVLNVLA